MDALQRFQNEIKFLEDERKTLLANLTTTQARCTSLIDEARACRRIANAPAGELHALSHVSHERRLQDEKWGSVEVLLDVPFGTGPIFDDALEFVRGQVAGHQSYSGKQTCCWYHVLQEEYHEVIAAKPGSKEQRQELVQLAAVCVKMIEIIDRKAAK